MLDRRLPMHGDSVTVNCKSPDSAADCFPLCSVADCSAFRLPPPPPPPPRPVNEGHTPVRLLLTVSLLSGFLFLSLAISTLLLYRRRRVLRRRRAATAPLPPDDGFGDGDEAGGGGMVHHVWYIRTVGLDEATVASIATLEYRGGGGGGDCAVCLGEFGDGELIRLLPRCAHAFHVPCIDTWLRAHVNCPLCRSPVVASSDPSAAPEAEAEGAEANEDQVFDEVTLSDSQAEGSELSSNTQSVDTATSAEDNTSTPKPIRRSASMDSPLFLVVVPAVQDDSVEGNRKAPHGREVRSSRGKEKEGCGAAGSSSGQVGRFGIGRSMSSSGRGFFFSRNGRSCGAVLPL